MYHLFANADLEQQITQLGTRTVMIAAVLLTILVLAAASTKNKKKYDKYKKPLFFSMASILVISTLILFSSTIYLNATSDSKGPVHWHADLEFWACGTELAVVNPTGRLSNKIGTPTLHEHNDKRIHLEGVVVDTAYDASMTKFMKVIGGNLTATELMVPVNADAVETTHTDGDGVPSSNAVAIKQYLGAYPADGKYTKKEHPNAFDSRRGDQTCDGQPAQVQTFLLRFNKENKTYSQSKLANPESYILRDESSVPPGDCLIIEFDIPKNRTDKLCKQYGVRDKDRCEQFGVIAEKKQKVCDIQEQRAGGTL